MRYRPHDYQRYAADFIKNHPIAALLLSMGLGKTSITLTAINDLLFDSFEVSRVLVIAPIRVTRVWAEEIEKWDHLRGLTYSIAVGTAEERRTALSRKADIYIINRENVGWLIDEMPFDFDMIIIDELSSFKNHQTKRFKALMKAKRIVGLTGTPTGNGLMDLYAEFRLLDMGQRLGRFIGQYRNTYFQLDKRNGMIMYSYKPLPGAEDAIYEKISDITVSMRATDHLKMPELIMSEYTVQLSEAEHKKYSDLWQELVLSLPDCEVTAANAASLSNKLSQMANGAIYDDSGKVIPIHDRKLDALEDIIESMNGSGISNMPRTVSPDHSKMEGTVFKIMALEQDIKDTQQEYDALIADMERRIKAVDDVDDRDLLTKRYLEFKSWDTIATEMFISKRKAYYLHNKALKSLRSDAVSFT